MPDSDMDDVPAQPRVKGTKYQERYGMMYAKCMSAPMANSIVNTSPAALLGLYG